jgi:Rrf2 family protein
MRLSLTKQTEYALRALVWLAQQDAARNEGATRSEGAAQPPIRQKAATIAEATGIPPVFAARVLAQLQRQGLLDARAGQQGGYTLARPAARISLLEVVESVEGPLITRACVLRDDGCGTDGTYCLLHSAWSTAQAALRAVLAQTSLATATQAGAALAAPPPAPQPALQPAPPRSPTVLAIVDATRPAALPAGVGYGALAPRISAESAV